MARNKSITLHTLLHYYDKIEDEQHETYIFKYRNYLLKSVKTSQNGVRDHSKKNFRALFLLSKNRNAMAPPPKPNPTVISNLNRFILTFWYYEHLDPETQSHIHFAFVHNSVLTFWYYENHAPKPNPARFGKWQLFRLVFWLLCYVCCGLCLLLCVYMYV